MKDKELRKRVGDLESILKEHGLVQNIALIKGIYKDSGMPQSIRREMDFIQKQVTLLKDCVFAMCDYLDIDVIVQEPKAIAKKRNVLRKASL